MLFGSLGGEFIDNVVTIWYHGPKSYTREEMIEIICHGGYVTSSQILELLCENGARLAQPGEFTLRAFLNGALDLTEAEAVNSLISAKTLKSKQATIRNLEGKLTNKINRIQDDLFNIITILEAEIDFSDDEIDKLSKTNTINNLDKIQLLIEERHRGVDPIQVDFR